MERLYPQLILDALKNVRYPASGKVCILIVAVNS